MGAKLTVVTRHEIELGSQGFNNEWYDLLCDMEANGVCVVPDTDNVCEGSYVEMPVQEVEQYISVQKEALKNGESLTENGLSLQTIVDELESMLAEADKRDGCVHFSIG